MIKGKIIKGVGGLYTIATDRGVYECAMRGIFRKDKITPSIGDIVEIEETDCLEKKGVVSRIHDRRNMLIRPRVANVDQALVVFAVMDPRPNIELLDKFIILAEEQRLEILICINKIDLDAAGEYSRIKHSYEKIGYRALAVSTKTGEGTEALKKELEGRITVLSGPSGVGKSSLINILLPDPILQTGELSKKIQRGKHTTRHAELIELQEDSFIVDTPGFTSLTLAHIKKEELSQYFIEFRPYLTKCRFRDCIHIKEQDCGIKAEVGGSISEERYQRYIKLYSER